jgi:acyl carrier protein
MTQIVTSSSRGDILEEIREIFVENFELEPDSVTLKAKMYDDLDIDSIDAVDLMVALKKRTGRKLDPDVFKQIRTVGDVVEAVHRLMNE